MHGRLSFLNFRRGAFAIGGLAACLAMGALAAPAAAQERFAGQWVVASAAAAPWASDPRDGADEAEARRIVGAHIAIDKGSFRAPEPLGCAKPTYAFSDVTADMLFEGSLNADGAGKATDPVVVARSLGVTAAKVRGMTASCSEVAFVLIDPDTILFGLNNRVFTLKRAK
jgi:hypothetical protein